MHTMMKRSIPKTGEVLPVIGCGTYRGFDIHPVGAGYQGLLGVLRSLFQAGGSALDSSPMYGRAEAVTGQLLAELGARRSAFLAMANNAAAADAEVAAVREQLASWLERRG